MIKMPEVGQHVCYCPGHSIENGIVKEVREDVEDACWVVYNCGGEWDRYREYTSAKTNLRDLQLGWRDDARNAGMRS